jgi:hypothetical protein
LVDGTIKIIMNLSSNFGKADIILLNKLYWLYNICNCFVSLLNLLVYEAIYEGLMRFHCYVYNDDFYIYLYTESLYVCYVC